MNYATINLQLGQEERECEVCFNHTPAVPGEGLEKGQAEEFELISLFDTETNTYLVHESDAGQLLEILAEEIIDLIKEAKL